MMSESAKNRAMKDDRVFHSVNRFITPQDEHIKERNPLLAEVIDKMLEIMKNEDPLFKYMYREMMFAGSYYKKTRVGKPEEFDLDLILTLPVDYSKIQFDDDRPGYARIKLPADSYKPEWEVHQKILNKWISNPHNYLNNDELRQWFESVVTRSFSRLEKRSDGWFILPIPGKPAVTVNMKKLHKKKKKFYPPRPQNQNFHRNVDPSKRIRQVKTKKSGPAFTLLVVYDTGKFDVDLVPALEFKTKPNLQVFSKINTIKFPWYLVPKPLKTGANRQFSWRFCFYRYEQDMLSVNGKIKPIIRHLKKLKDLQNWSSVLASYYIETLIYHELSTNTLNLNGSSMSELLLYMLTKLNEACERRSIPYYWDPRCNLLAEKTADQLLPIRKRMEKIIRVISDDPSQTIEYFLTADERQKLSIAGPSPPSTPTTEDSNADSGVSSPTDSQEEKLLISFLDPEVPEAPRDIKSMDQIAILTRTVAALTDEIKTMKSSFSDEIKELRSCVQSLTEQTSAMSEVLGLLVRREMGGFDVVHHNLI